MSTVELPTWLVALGLGALLASVGVAGWALGRSAPLPTVALPSQPQEARLEPGLEPQGVGEPEVEREPGTEPGKETAEPELAEAPSEEGPDTERAQVARYFAELEAAAATHPSVGSTPQAQANALVAGALAGDTSGFDDLIEANERLMREIGAVKAPEPCRVHKERTLSGIRDANATMRDLKSALEGGDFGAIMGMQERAQAMEGDLRSIDSLGQEIRGRYDLP